MQETNNMSTQPKTSHMIHLFQIVTAPDYNYDEYDAYHTKNIIHS
jgi:hypothetical protein